MDKGWRTNYGMGRYCAYKFDRVNHKLGKDVRERLRWYESSPNNHTIPTNKN